MGKTIKHSTNQATQQKALHLVSAWSNEQQLILAQQKVAERRC